MLVKRNRIYYLLFLLTGFFACQNVSESSTEAPSQVTEELFTFKAVPQNIPEQEVTALSIGEVAPDFNLPGVDGKYHQLKEYDASEVLVIIFTCNHCPTAQAYEDRMIQLTNDYRNKGVTVIAISPNSINGILLEELGYSDVGDSYEDMIIRAEDKNFNFHYLYDGDTHEASMKYGPVATPHAYVFNKKRELTYIGRLDSSEKPGTGNADDLRAAIESTLKGEPVELSTTKTFGCSIKWAWKNEYAEKVNKEWSEKEVTLEDIDVAGIRTLLSNNSDDLRLINVWATWCGPCVIEYPEFVDIHRMFVGRAFEFVSISTDNPESKNKAQKFLQKSSSALSNYIFSGGDKYALIEAIDPDWDGALPYTILVEPGGSIVYKKMGPINAFELKKAIVNHSSIGRYY